ncbi:hypothetical protein [Novosphingobium mangrovi (ex Huang et al. 2023)]|uniref:Uncharacterized protein n=1 Tax=Novosphingobium mangrovi (ex Huang et al. 2023) TaxID=2976432 RepID=A0ABT2I870_9SPHN|nr:hypothetical protein [Novosphingobium mangrovi (ex Huang et al. 2023)]MCT2400783.1 hypothetical protein [Novosphingobium mangrovi (ex Huang et al. 2023)]
MSQTAMIVSIITLIGWLILVTRNPEIRNLGAARAARLALIWATIIIGLVVLIQVTGFRIEQ